MAKKGLATLASKQINSTATVDKESATQKTNKPLTAPCPAELIEEFEEEDVLNAVFNLSPEKAEEIKKNLRKPGRPSALTAPDEVNYTLKMSAALIRRIKGYAIAHEEETGEKLTQKEIIIKAVETYLNKKTI